MAVSKISEMIELARSAHYKAIDARGAIELMRSVPERQAFARASFEAGMTEHQDALEEIEKYFEVAMEAAASDARIDAETVARVVAESDAESDAEPAAEVLKKVAALTEDCAALKSIGEHWHRVAARESDRATDLERTLYSLREHRLDVDQDMKAAREVAETVFGMRSGCEPLPLLKICVDFKREVYRLRDLVGMKSKALEASEKAHLDLRKDVEEARALSEQVFGIATGPRAMVSICNDFKREVRRLREALSAKDRALDLQYSGAMETIGKLNVELEQRRVEVCELTKAVANAAPQVTLHGGDVQHWFDVAQHEGKKVDDLAREKDRAKREVAALEERVRELYEAACDRDSAFSWIKKPFPHAKTAAEGAKHLIEQFENLKQQVYDLRGRLSQIRDVVARDEG